MTKKTRQKKQINKELIEFRKALKMTLLSLNITQRDLYIKTNIPYSMVSYYINGIGNLSDERVKRVCKVLKLNYKEHKAKEKEIIDRHIAKISSKKSRVRKDDSVVEVSSAQESTNDEI
jgi:predicted transcriptional regulator